MQRRPSTDRMAAGDAAEEELWAACLAAIPPLAPAAGSGCGGGAAAVGPGPGLAQAAQGGATPGALGGWAPAGAAAGAEPGSGSGSVHGASGSPDVDCDDWPAHVAHSARWRELQEAAATVLQLCLAEALQALGAAGCGPAPPTDLLLAISARTDLVDLLGDGRAAGTAGGTAAARNGLAGMRDHGGRARFELLPQPADGRDLLCAVAHEPGFERRAGAQDGPRGVAGGAAAAGRPGRHARRGGRGALRARRRAPAGPGRARGAGRVAARAARAACEPAEGPDPRAVLGCGPARGGAAARRRCVRGGRRRSGAGRARGSGLAGAVAACEGRAGAACPADCGRRPGLAHPYEERAWRLRARSCRMQPPCGAAAERAGPQLQQRQLGRGGAGLAIDQRPWYRHRLGPLKRPVARLHVALRRRQPRAPRLRGARAALGSGRAAVPCAGPLPDVQPRRRPPRGLAGRAAAERALAGAGARGAAQILEQRVNAWPRSRLGPTRGAGAQPVCAGRLAAHGARPGAPPEPDAPRCIRACVAAVVCPGPGYGRCAVLRKRRESPSSVERG